MSATGDITREAVLHWAAVGLYIAGAALFAHAVIFDHPRRLKAALWGTAAGLVPHSVALGLRWARVGHGPYMLKHEVLSSNAWIAVVMLLIVLWRRPRWSAAALPVLPLVVLMMGLGLFSSPEARDLPPSLRSIWLAFHVLFNKLAVGAFLLSAGAGWALVLKLKGRRGRLLDRLPAVEALEAYTARFVGFGFVFWTATIGAGAIWAEQSWGRYWGWDPIESWSLVTWLAYGTLLHIRLFFRPRPIVVGAGTLVCFGISVLTVFVFPFLIPSMHSAYFQ